MNAYEQRIVVAATAWWAAKRPAAWTQTQHLKHPTVNTTTPAEAALALHVATLMAQSE